MGRIFFFSFLVFTFVWRCSPVEQKGSDPIVFTDVDTVRSETYKPQGGVDSLIKFCYNYTRVIPPQKLREAALQIQDSVPKGSSIYFFGQAYLIQSYFYEGNTDMMMKLLDQTEAMPELKHYPFDQIRLKYVRINLYRILSRFDDALQVCGDILNIRPVTPEQTVRLRGMFNGVLLQLATAYIQSYRKEEGFHFFLKLQQSDNPVLVQYCRRDLAVVTAYMAFKAGLTDTARKRIREALQLPFQGDSAINLARDYCYAADIYSHLAGETEKGVYYWEQVLHLVKKDDPQGMLSWAQAGLGNLYSKTGRFNLAVQLQYEALRRYEARKDEAGMSFTYSLLANLHTYWGFYTKSEEYVREAYQMAVKAGDDDSRGKALLARYKLLKETGQKDSLLLVLKRAEEAFRIAENPLKVLETKGLRGLELMEEDSSWQEGTELLQHVLGEPVAAGLKYFANYSSGLAIGMVRRGDENEGLKLLCEAIRQMELEEQIPELLSRYSFLKDYYFEKGDCQKFYLLSHKYDVLKDTLFNRGKMQMVAKARIEYDVEKRMQMNRLLEAELKLKETTLQNYILFGVLTMILILGTAGWFWWRHRSLRLKQQLTRILLEEQKKHLLDVIEAQRQLNRKNEELRLEIKRILSARQVAGKEIADLEALLRTMAPRLLTEEEELNFRQVYQRLYPEFLMTLRRRCPVITKNEELLCMLINIGLSTNDIALALGISRESVNKSRYRIRKKLNLGKDEELNDWIRKS